MMVVAVGLVSEQISYRISFQGEQTRYPYALHVGVREREELSMTLWPEDWKSGVERVM